MFTNTNENECVCANNFIEAVNLVTLQPDIADPLITPESKIFDQTCFPLSNLSNVQNDCYGKINNYFATASLSTNVIPTTTFGSFYVQFKINETKNALSDVCRGLTQAKTFLFQKVKYDSYLPHQEADLISKTSPDAEMKYLVQIPSDKMVSGDCTMFIPDESLNLTFYSVICEIVFFVTFSDNFFTGILSEGQFLQILQLDLETQTFYNSKSGLNLKSVLIQRFNDECVNCEYNIDDGLTMKTCKDAKCEVSITNSTVHMSQRFYFILAYNSPIYNYNRQIQRVEVYQTGNLIDSSKYTIGEASLGTNSGKMVSYY